MQVNRTQRERPELNKLPVFQTANVGAWPLNGNDRQSCQIANGHGGIGREARQVEPEDQ
jgi:hypothetical protein